MQGGDGTHDDGRLFGWDGETLWTEPTLSDQAELKTVRAESEDDDG